MVGEFPYPELLIPGDEQELQWRGKPGTSFFFNFDPLCRLCLKIHEKASAPDGRSVDKQIREALWKRFIEIYLVEYQDFLRLRQEEALLEICQIDIDPYGENGFNAGGEVYLWLKGLLLLDDSVFEILKKLKKSFDENPITIQVEDKTYRLLLYGWGFRHV